VLWKGTVVIGPTEKTATSSGSSASVSAGTFS
jgi:hypothetical protein